MAMNAEERYQLWLDRLPQDDPMRKELLSIRGNQQEINDRFYQEIEFGTAGLRGICGAGTNRMNPCVALPTVSDAGNRQLSEEIRRRSASRRGNCL